MPKQNIIAGLDIGSSKISVIVGNTLQGSTQKIGVIGVGHAHLRRAFERALLLISTKRRRLSVKAIANARINGRRENRLRLCRHFPVSISLDKCPTGLFSVANNEISHDDVDRAMLAAKAISIPADREILHVIQQNFCRRRSGPYQRTDWHVWGAS